VAQDLVHVGDAPAAVERVQAVRPGQIVDREARLARLVRVRVRVRFRVRVRLRVRVRGRGRGRVKG